VAHAAISDYDQLDELVTAMRSSADIRSTYLRDAVASASPTHLLVMLYDRLLLDLRWAEEAQLAEDWHAASVRLIHAQDILAELTSTLNPAIWDGGNALMSLYLFVARLMRTANVSHDVGRTLECIDLLEPLRLAWHAAADQVATATEQPRISAVG
jgi:flagellar protein FliS